MTEDRHSAPLSYTANVSRENDWFMIRVVELGVLTQASRWSEVPKMARGLIAATLDRDPDEIFVVIVPVFDTESSELLRSSQEDEARAKALASQAGDAKRAAVQRLKASGWTLQAIGEGLGLSYQRVEQLLKSRYVTD